MPDGKPDQPDLKFSKDFDMIGLAPVWCGFRVSRLKMLQQVHAGIRISTFDDAEGLWMNGCDRRFLIHALAF